MRGARNEENVGLNGVARAGQDSFTLDGLLAMQARSFHEPEPFFDSAGMLAIAVVVDDSLAPGNAKGGVLAAAENYGVFNGVVGLVVVGIQSAGWQLAPGSYAS